MREISNITNREYDTEECVPIVNKTQHDLYVKNNVYPIDMYYSIDRIVYIYRKKDTKELYAKWQKRELK